MQLVGDDLFVTNTRRLKKGIELGWRVIPSSSSPTRSAAFPKRWRRSGRRMRRGIRRSLRTVRAKRRIPLSPTLAVADGYPPDQDGRAPAAAKRVAKYNRLLRIEEELGDAAVYPGFGAFGR